MPRYRVSLMHRRSFTSFEIQGPRFIADFRFSGIAVSLVSVFLLVSCQSPKQPKTSVPSYVLGQSFYGDSSEASIPGFVHKGYEEIVGDIINPDRGFFRRMNHGWYSGRWDTPYEEIDGTSLTDLEATASNILFSSNLMHVYFHVPLFRDKDFSGAYLNEVEDVFRKSQESGIKIIPRWTYDFPGTLSEYPARGQDGANTASKEQIKRHIRQLASILNKYKNTIAFMEAGFLGYWGEWHGDQHGNNKEWTKTRKEIVETLLQSLDKSIFIAIRYQEDFIRLQNLKGAFRLGLHQDCPNTKWDNYLKYGLVMTDSPQGGEVCQLPPRTNYNCQTMIEYFERFQFDVLNGTDWVKSNSRFEQQGCLTEIRNRLGYRFVVSASKYIDGILYFQVENRGFGKSYKSRMVAIKNGRTIIPTTIDVKDWKPGTITIEQVYIGSTDNTVVEIIIDDAIKFANTTGNKIFLHREPSVHEAS